MVTANLYFIDNGIYILLSKDVNMYEACQMMLDFLHRRNYNYYYIRQWQTDEGWMYDVGSWTQFFLWGYEKEKE